jgi:hypothetical protein
MTKIAIVPNAAGTGTFTIEAPNSNSNRTLTLPDEAGTVMTDATTLLTSQLPAQLSVSSSAAAGALTVDASGRVLMAGQPVFRAGFPPPDGVVTVNLGAKHPFSSAGLNVGNHYDTANYRFTAPVSGTYQFSACLWVNDNSAGDCAPKVNGAYIAAGTGDVIMFAQQAQAMQTNLSGTFTIYLSANDQVELFARNYTTSYYSGHSWWEGRLIG